MDPQAKIVTFSNAANLASLLGLAVSIWVLKNISNIKQFYLFSARVPEQLNKLTELATSIAGYQKIYPASHQDLLLQIASVETVLESLEAKVTGKTKKSIKQVREKLSEIDKPNPTKENVWAIYIQIHKLIMEMSELQSDMKWER